MDTVGAKATTTSQSPRLPDRALDLTGLGVVRLRTLDLTRDDLHGVYADLGIESVEDWGILDLLLGLVINLSRGDFAGVVESVTNDSISPEAPTSRPPREPDGRGSPVEGEPYQGPGSLAD